MKLYGLIGYPLGHSFSKAYFENKFNKEGLSDSKYENYPIQKIGLISELIKNNPELSGLNITIPYKQDIIPFLSDIDNQAKEIGAVNCVKIYREGENYKLKGYNTDVTGFMDSLLNMIGPDRPNALVFGTGGASKAVIFVLKELGIPYKCVSRFSKEGVIPYEEVTRDLISQHKLLINCTPLGTFPNTSDYVNIPYESISQGHYLYDLVYNPSETQFLKKGRMKGATVKNGYEMLVLQAESGYKIFCE
ncbi:MAG: shikimate dehydrogenase [Rikenellaceae bacterium]|nr:shikimate dehydrogenase [Rikenellaceae bacterium]